MKHFIKDMYLALIGANTCEFDGVLNQVLANCEELESERYENMVKIYAFDCSLVTDANYYHLYQKVSAERKERVSRFQFRSDAISSICGELLTRLAFHDVTSLPLTGDVFFSKTAQGKPYVSNYPGFYYNISHSGCWVVCATANHDVGVDIEQMSKQHLKLIDTVFSQAERELYHMVPIEHKTDVFYSIWTGKESCLKHYGCGLTVPLDSIDIKGNDLYVMEERLPCKLHFYYIHPKYKLATCSTDTEHDDSITYVTLFDFEQL